MSNLAFLIDQLAIGIYGVLIAFILLNGWRVLQAQGEIRSTYFELERDLARQRQVSSLTNMILAAEAIVLVVGVQFAVVPFFESERTLEEIQAAREAVIEDGVFNSPTPLAPGAIEAGLDIPEVTLPGAEGEVGFISTPTLTPTPVGTIIPNAPPIQGCTDDRAMLQVPTNGMRVFAPVVVRGTAFTTDFSSAKIEVSGPSTNDQYVVIDTILQPERTLNAISQFVPARFSEGRYEFRLTVFDNLNTLVATCMVNIYISAIEPTATPTPRPNATSQP